MSGAEQSGSQKSGTGPDHGLLKRIQADIRAKTKLLNSVTKAYLVPDDACQIVHPGRIPRLLGVDRDSTTARLVYDRQTSILCALIYSGASECLAEYTK